MALAAIALVLVALVGLVLANLVSGPSDVAYQNDDYQVPPPNASPPPIPFPQNEQEAIAFTRDNALYQQAMPVPVRCVSTPIDVAAASEQALDDHFEGLMECLVRTWQPPITKAGYQILRPTVTIYGDSIQTKCGNSGVNAFYCSGDQQIYYSKLLPDAFPGVKGKKWAADVIMAHEYGHLLQGRTGIFGGGVGLAQNAPDKDTSLRYSRRLETQADCLSATFLRSVATSLGIRQDDVEGILESYMAVGDDTLSGKPAVVGDHGLARSRRYWGQVGLSTGDLGRCNTFTAQDALVR